MVIIPPKTTDGITPISLDANPLSKAPNSLEEMMKMLFSAETLPFISSGVLVWRMVERTIILMPSNNPERNKAAKEIQKTVGF